MYRPLALAFLAACTADVGDSDTSEPVPEPRPLATPSSACPDFGDGGRIEFTSNGQQRTAYVFFPPDRPANLPVVFHWHPLGASASMMVNYLDLEDLAVENDAIVVVPDALESNPFEWNFVAGEDEAQDDLVLFDDLRACLATDLQADMHRVYTTGMSAGGLWSSFLGIHRGDAFATLLIMSGGTGDVVQYGTPAVPANGTPYPALLVWGGPTDTFDAGMFQIDFEDTTLAFRDQLRADGHFVVQCEHDRGHDLPPDAVQLSIDWLFPHTFGLPSPWLDRDPTELSDICSVPE